jgi:hypothetical protein
VKRTTGIRAPVGPRFRTSATSADTSKMRKILQPQRTARRRSWSRVAVVAFAAASACFLLEAPAYGVGDPALDQLIAANPVPGWTALPSSALQPLVTYEDKVLSDVVGQSVTSAAQGWQGADPSERLVVFLVRTPQAVPDADRQAREAVISGCASSTGNAPAGPVQGYDSIPGSQEAQCAGENALGETIAGTSMAWVEGNVMVFLEGVGLPQTQVESVARGQDAAIPGSGVQETNSHTVLIVGLVTVVLAVGAALFVVARRRKPRSSPFGPWPAGSFQHSPYAPSPYPVSVDASTPYGSAPYTPAPYTPAPYTPSPYTPSPHTSTQYASAPYGSSPPAPAVAATVSPGWRPDPTGRYEQRYWSGTTWTEHVYSQGRSGYDLFSAPTLTAVEPESAGIPPFAWGQPNEPGGAGSQSGADGHDQRG